MDFHFRSLYDTKDLKKLVDFLIKQNLNYPNYEDWVLRTKEEIISEYKTALIGYSDNKIIANIIYQPHKQLNRIREIKNMRIHPNVRRRYVGAFLLRQAEIENRDNYDAIICDMRSNHKGVFNILTFMGYRPICNKSLYDPNNTDMVMMKVFDKESGEISINKAKNLIS